jgi:hypothetical protein
MWALQGAALIQEADLAAAILFRNTTVFAGLAQEDYLPKKNAVTWSVPTEMLFGDHVVRPVLSHKRLDLKTTHSRICSKLNCLTIPFREQWRPG